MNDELEFKILEALAKHSFGEWADITTVFDDQFLIPDVERGDLIGKNSLTDYQLERIIEFLTFMQEMEHLSFRDYSYLSEIGDRDKGEPVTLKKTISIDARLMPKGNLYYKGLIQSKIANQGTETNNLLKKEPAGNEKIIQSPTFNPHYIKDIYDLLKNHFSIEKQADLLKLLKNNTTLVEPLIFLDSGNRLADAFKQLKESDIITGCTKKVLENWILDHFKYSFRQKTKKFTAHYLNDIISSKNDKCQNPLLNVMLNKETGQYQITKV